MISGCIAAILDRRTLVINRGTREFVSENYLCVIRDDAKVVALLKMVELKEKFSIYRLIWRAEEMPTLSRGYPVTLTCIDNFAEGGQMGLFGGENTDAENHIIISTQLSR